MHRRFLTRTIALAAATLAATLTLTACGGSSDPLSTTSAESSAGSSASSAGSAATSGSSDASSASSDATSGGTAGPIVVGSANFPENQLLAEIYAAALTANGVEASTQLNIGSREIYLPALQDGSIDLIPEYSGALLLYFDPAATATESEAVFTALQDVIPDGLAVLDKSAAEDKDAVVVTQATAEANNLTSIADLAPVAADFILGGPPEWETRPTGPEGLKAKYGLTFKEFKALDAGTLTVAALTSDQVQAGNVFTTDPAILANDLVILEDPESLFAAQNILPLINADKVTPEVEDALNTVSAKLDTTILTELLGRVTVDKEDAASVAQEWVAANG